MVEAAALKRERVKEEEGGEAADRDAKRARTAGVGRPSAVTVTLEVDREGTLIGQLVVGPIKPHQKVGQCAATQLGHLGSGVCFFSLGI